MLALWLKKTKHTFFVDNFFKQQNQCFVVDLNLCLWSRNGQIGLMVLGSGGGKSADEVMDAKSSERKGGFYSPGRLMLSAI